MPTHWWNGSPIESGAEKKNSKNQVPDIHTKWQWIPNCVPYYRTSFKKKSKTFTLHDGSIYRPLYHKLEKSLLLRKGESQNHHDQKSKVDSRISHDGLTHFLFPAFFHTIDTLHKDKRDFSIVIRTFGSDLSDVAAAISAFATGHHSDYPINHAPQHQPIIYLSGH